MQLRVREALGAEADGLAVRAGGDDAVEAGRDGRLGQRAEGRVPALQELPALLRVEEAAGGDRQVRVPHQVLQHRAEVAGQAAHGLAVEQRGVVAEAQQQRVGAVADVEALRLARVLHQPDHLAQHAGAP